MRWMTILVAAGCTAPAGTDGPGDTDPTDGVPTDGTPPTETGPVIETGTTETGHTGGPTGDTASPYDCSVLPPIPLLNAMVTNLPDFDTSEDFDIDGDGFMCTNHSGNLACRDMAGNTKIVSPNIGSTAGIRVMADGNWVVNNVGEGSLVLIDAVTGGQTTVMSGIAYPNGLEVDADGYAYIGENGAGNVRQVEVATGAGYVVATGIAAPNGVILSPDGQTLYAGSFGGGIIYAVDRLGPTDWDTPRVLYNPPNPDGGFDGINIDICGNVYITEYTVGRVYRLTDDGGLGNGEVVDLQESWIPNMRWGHDINGWDSHVLYVTAWSSIYALDMGIQGKRHILMP